MTVESSIFTLEYSSAEWRSVHEICALLFSLVFIAQASTDILITAETEMLSAFERAWFTVTFIQRE